MAENLQEYVKNHPFGQTPISDENPSWNYYARVIEDTKARRKPWLEWCTPTNVHKNEQSFEQSSLDKLKVDRTLAFENSKSIHEDESAIGDTRGYNPTTQTDEQKTKSKTNDLVHLSSNKERQQDCSAGCVTAVTSREPPVPWIPHSSLRNSHEVFCQKKLLILDVNGLLADFVFYEPIGYKADSFLGNKAGKVTSAGWFLCIYQLFSF